MSVVKTTPSSSGKGPILQSGSGQIQTIPGIARGLFLPQVKAGASASGSVSVISVASRGGRRGFAEVLLERLQTLTKDNDATPCKVDRRQNRRGLDAALKKCFASKTRYAAVAVVAKLPQPPLHVRGAPVLIACVLAASFETFTNRTDGVASFDMATTSYESHQ